MKKKNLYSKAQTEALAKELIDFAKREGLVAKACAQYIPKYPKLVITEQDVESCLYEAVHYQVDRATKDPDFDPAKAPYGVISKFNNLLKNFIRGERAGKRAGWGNGTNIIRIDEKRDERDKSSHSTLNNLEGEMSSSMEIKDFDKGKLESSLSEFLRDYENLQNSRFPEAVSTQKQCLVSRIYELLLDGNSKKDIQEALEVSNWKMRTSLEELEIVASKFSMKFKEETSIMEAA